MNNDDGGMRSVKQVGWVGRGAIISQVALKGGLLSTHARHQLLHHHLTRETYKILHMALTNMVPLYA